VNVLRLLVLLALAQPDAEIAYKAGVAAFQRRDYPVAAQQLKRAAELDPRHAAAWKALGVVHAAQENYAAADIPFQRACELDRKLEDACYYYGRNAFALNRFELSLAAMKKALPHDRRPFRIHLGIAQSLEGLGRTAEAEAQFRTAVQLLAERPAAPDFDPRLHYSVFLFRQGRLEPALASIQPVIADYPAAARPRLEAARPLFHLGRLAEAGAELEKAVAADPGYTAAHLLLGRIYARLGQPEKAAHHSRLGAASVTSR
jgi:Tfp pilus assembly protein PilF